MTLWIALPFLFLSVAQERVALWGWPAYPLELCVFALAVAGAICGPSLRRFRKAPLLRFFLADRCLWMGAALFFLGATMSLAAHPLTGHTLGLWKSWFLIPLVFFILGLGFWSPFRYRELLSAWLLGTLPLAFLAAQALLSARLTYDGRLAFPQASPNFLAELLGPAILIGGFFLVSRRQRLAVVLPGTGILLLLGTLFLATRSYGAWLALAAACLTALLAGCFRARRPRTWGAVLLVLLLGGGLLVWTEAMSEKGQALWRGEARSSFASRVMIWRAAIHIGQDNPLFPIAPGGFQEAYLGAQARFPPYLEWAVPQPHNLGLALWLQTGIMGLAGFSLFVGRILWLLGSVRGTGGEHSHRALLLALWAFFLVFGVFDTPYFRNDLAFLFWSLSLLSLALVAQKKRSGERSREPF